MPATLNTAVISLLVFLKQALHDAADVGIGHRDGVVLVKRLAHTVHLYSDICNQCGTDQECRNRKESVDGKWITAEVAFCKSIDAGLREIDQSGEANDGTVDTTKCGETENLGRVVGHGRVVERAEEDEKDDVDVACPKSGNRSNNPDRSDDNNKYKKNAGSADIVEKCAQERCADDASNRERPVEKFVDLGSGLGGSKHVNVLLLDRCNEIVLGQSVKI